ncbi:MAG: galactokinase [Propionibacteriaceae bacterium]|jgi:galactokinase|nr:galactokinase [Propionibacteriaceae bacterium]
MSIVSTVLNEFQAQFTGEPEGIWEAPGRVNLIGEHTDYNAGLVLPIALPQRTYVAIRRREDRKLRFVSVGMEASQPLNLDEVEPGKPSSWERYPVGVIWALEEAGYPMPGVEAAFISEVPVGSGLSSSAAIEGAIAAAMSDLCNLGLLADDEGRATLANICQRAENHIAQAPTGGMDQAASLRSHEGYALNLDCSDASVRHVPFQLEEAGLALLVIDTQAPHSHTTGEYGRRRADCEQACAQLGFDTLREITPEMLEPLLPRLSNDRLRARVRHVVTETERVRLAVLAMEANDFAELGRLFVDSHASMRDDYEISCPELDQAVVTALECGALGARMTGGGFGGSAIALVYTQSLDSTRAAIGEAFAARGFSAPQFLIAQAGPPAQRTEY